MEVTILVGLAWRYRDMLRLIDSFWDLGMAELLIGRLVGKGGGAAEFVCCAFAAAAFLTERYRENLACCCT